MNYDTANANWEEFFIQEALELEEKMASLQFEDLQRSRIRLSLENKILDWNKYHNWFLERFQCTSLKSDLSDVDLENLRNTSAKTLKSYDQFNFWSEDLVPLEVWDGHLIVLGLGFNENLINISNISNISKCIFILAEPSVLSFIAESLKMTAEVSEQEDRDSSVEFELLDLGDRTHVPSSGKLNFSSLNPAANEKSGPIWDYLSDRHEEYSFEAKKIFSAYVVLKIVNNQTQVFKMDSELEKNLASTGVFNFDLTTDSPFQRISQTGISESLSVSQLSKPILNFKYVCITALRRGHVTVGFLVGLKTDQLAENDQDLLEDLAKESA